MCKQSPEEIGFLFEFIRVTVKNETIQIRGENTLLHRCCIIGFVLATPGKASKRGFSPSTKIYEKNRFNAGG